MSQIQLKSLLATSRQTKGSHKRSVCGDTSHTMNEELSSEQQVEMEARVTELEAQIENLREQISAQDS